MILIKNIEIYSPEYLGKKDLLIAGHNIEMIEDKIDIDEKYVEIIDGTGKKLIPGLIDKHIHITGGGGEGGFTTRVPEVDISELMKSGITSVVGLLGTDASTRTLNDLLAKSKAINEFGISCYTLTGSYEYPVKSFTDSVRNDIVFLNECIGCKIALSDHRDSCISVEELKRLASQVYVGGKLSGKQGILTIHMGDSKKGLEPVLECLRTSELPITLFHPTHVNRNNYLLEQSLKFMNKGGYIDLTCGDTGNTRPAIIAKELLTRNDYKNIDKVTVSSDGNGSYSTYDKDGKLLNIGASSIFAIYDELVYMINDLDISLTEALRFVTSNVANSLGLENKKGYIKTAYDADLLIIDDKMKIQTSIANGEIIYQDGKVLKNIPFA